MMMLPPCSKLDYETRLYKGCGASELFSITLASGCICLPISFIGGFSLLDGLHALFITFAILVSTTLLLVYCIANVLNFIKRGKPDNWHLRVFFSLIHPVLSSNLVYKSGRWLSVRGN